jgi:hypothetical protein
MVLSAVLTTASALLLAVTYSVPPSGDMARLEAPPPRSPRVTAVVTALVARSRTETAGLVA